MKRVICLILLMGAAACGSGASREPLANDTNRQQEQLANIANQLSRQAESGTAEIERALENETAEIFRNRENLLNANMAAPEDANAAAAPDAP